MNVKLENLDIQNFKGIKNLSIDFSNHTTISGANGLGKTSIFDSFTWLLFGKDSTDRKDFNIKNLDIDSKTNRHLITQVTATIMVDDRLSTIKKTYQEKWTKKRGEETEEYTGNETLYYWNEVPLTMKDFQQKVENIMSENLFKLITSPSYFNSLKPAERREVLINLAGNIISDAQLANVNEGFKTLLLELSNKTIIEYKTELANKRKKLKTDLFDIGPRINELLRNEIAIVPNLENTIHEAKIAIRLLDAEMLDESKANEKENKVKIDIQNKIFAEKRKLNDLINEIKATRQKEVAEKESETSGLFSKLNNLALEQGRLFKDIETNKQYIEANERNLVPLRLEFKSVSESQLKFDENDFRCPTCCREHDAENIEAKKLEMQENFNTDKARKASELNAKGKGLNATNAQLQSDIQKLNDKDIELSKLINEAQLAIDIDKEKILLPIEKIIENDDNILEQRKTIEILEMNLDNLIDENKPKIESQLVHKKIQLQDELDQLLKQETLQNEAAKIAERVHELKTNEKVLAKQLSEVEKMEFVAAEFNKAKMLQVEKSVNEKFEFVKFKLFESQINGGETEVCECLIKGVPYADANNASRINAGIDIINTLTKFNYVTAPIFVDNAESINTIIDTKCQLIELVVTTDLGLCVERF